MSSLVFPGLPVQVRDAALKLQDSMPKSDVNKEYYTQNIEREVSIKSVAVLDFQLKRMRLTSQWRSASLGTGLFFQLMHAGLNLSVIMLCQFRSRVFYDTALGGSVCVETSLCTH